ncbi:Arc family DNA-binding protein [Streptomyces canus]|uniref:HicB family RNase H-like nuclease n=1 Tax=Streptomyces canus TaxID=58343 RepID=A0AAW8FKZ9_9ACTN|nr:Arc family DNA-binding protein [Streptomyces canus]MDQ0760536.1 putative HicB family RNase H-like nuclease [Streptomyces canus]MDQ0910817.1 putative HicB family RNase H-like nuclease [Streptomyces canus]MDQ1070838.1 putative HicB family RNase H-like nuclease [Streptomyces canus]
MLKFTLRIPDDLHARLITQAETDRRSLNSEILHLLEVALTTVRADDESP